MTIKIRRGLDLPISGEPDQRTIAAGPAVCRVGLVGDDYVGMRPTMAVKEGDPVQLGQLLFEDKKTPGVRYTSPGSGHVVAINRGSKRKFESIVIELAGEEEITFNSFEGSNFAALDRAAVKENLVASGLWTAFRTRPFSRVPAPDSDPHAIFAAAIDTNPLAADPQPIILEREADFSLGLQVLTCLTDGRVYVCKPRRGAITLPVIDRVSVQDFDGPHPAGLPGTHVHFLEPVSERKTVWTINYQDVLAVGRLFMTGRLSVERVISVAGPVVARPGLVRTRIGASVDDLVRGALFEGNHRIISGSVLGGRRASEATAFLGRYHLQVSAIVEGRPRQFLGWMTPGFDRFSVLPVFASALSRGARRFALTSWRGGDDRPIVPIGCYDKVMPLDIVTTELLKSLVVGNAERSQQLGCLELDEEDLALCSFVCPGKYEYGPHLRAVLRKIEEEG